MSKDRVLDIRVQRWCAWSIVPFVVIYFAAFAGLAHFLPPSAPTVSSDDLVAFYDSNRLGIRAGQLICLVCSAAVLLWPAAISAQMARVERGAFPLLSIMQYAAAVVLAVMFMLCSLIWSIAAFRTDIEPGSLRMLHDAGWLIFVMAYPEYLVQLICVALVGLADKRAEPFLPRWACFMTFAVALSGVGGGFATFFKTGPFAWNGLIGFWVPILLFLAWLLVVILPFTLRAIARQEQEAAIES